MGDIISWFVVWWLYSRNRQSTPLMIAYLPSETSGCIAGCPISVDTEAYVPSGMKYVKASCMNFSDASIYAEATTAIAAASTVLSNFIFCFIYLN